MNCVIYRMDRDWDQRSVVSKVDSAIKRINQCPVDTSIGFTNTYPEDSDLSFANSIHPLKNRLRCINEYRRHSAESNPQWKTKQLGTV